KKAAIAITGSRSNDGKQAHCRRRVNAKAGLAVVDGYAVRSGGMIDPVLVFSSTKMAEPPMFRSSTRPTATEVFSHTEAADGRIGLKQPGGIGFFAGDLSEAEQKLVWATQAAPVPDLFHQKVDGVA